MNKKIAVLRVVTIENEERLNNHGRLIEKYFSDINTTSFCINDQKNGVHDPESHKIATKKICELAHSIEEEFDGVIISCVGEPGLNELKKTLSIPVTGAGTAVASFALNFGRKFGIIGLREEAPDSLVRILGDKIITSVRPDKVMNTNDIDTKEGKQSIIDAAVEMEKQGVDAIILACTGMSTNGLAKELSEFIIVPVIDPVYAEALVVSTMSNYKEIFM